MILHYSYFQIHNHTQIFYDWFLLPKRNHQIVSLLWDCSLLQYFQIFRYSKSIHSTIMILFSLDILFISCSTKLFIKLLIGLSVFSKLSINKLKYSDCNLKVWGILLSVSIYLLFNITLSISKNGHFSFYLILMLMLIFLLQNLQLFLLNHLCNIFLSTIILLYYYLSCWLIPLQYLCNS